MLKGYTQQSNEYVEFDYVDFLSVGDVIKNAAGEWVIEGKIVTITHKFFRKPQYNHRFICKKVK